VGGDRHGGAVAAGEPFLRLRRSPGARARLRPPRAILRRELRGVSDTRAPGPRDAAEPAAFPPLRVPSPARSSAWRGLSPAAGSRRSSSNRFRTRTRSSG
jgi:hypothetical protein